MNGWNYCLMCVPACIMILSINMGITYGYYDYKHTAILPVSLITTNFAII